MKYRGTIEDDLSGEIVRDLFFLIFTGPLHCFCKEPGVLAIENTKEPVIEVDARDDRWSKTSSGRCQLHPDSHDICRLEFVRGVPDAPTDKIDLLGGVFDNFVYLGPAIQQALEQGNFRGTRFADAEIDFEVSMPFDPSEIRALCFDGCGIQRSYAVNPPEENRCSRCGFSPIACPTCSIVEHFCPNCKKRTVALDIDGIKGLTPEDNGDLESTQDFSGVTGPVLDFDFWDGSDFLGGEEAIVTGRVVDLLLSLNPETLGIQPRPCHVGGHDPGEYEHLRSRRFQDAYTEQQDRRANPRHRGRPHV